MRGDRTRRTAIWMSSRTIGDFTLGRGTFEPGSGCWRRRLANGRARTALRLAVDDSWCLTPLEGGGKQVAGRKAAVGPPFLGDDEDLLLAGEVVELTGGLDGSTERKIARQDDVLSVERNDERALHGPGTYPRNCGELCHEIVVWQAAQDAGIQPAIRQSLGEVTECVDLAP